MNPSAPPWPAWPERGVGFGWRDLVEPGQVFPVHQDRNAGAGPPWPRFYLPLDFKVIKDLKTAVDSYGVHAPFTITLLEQISFNALTPDDWKQLARATLSPGQYLVWRAAYRELAMDQAQRNAQGGNREWNADMLLGEGARAGNNNQHEYPEPVYGQIQQIGRTAWRALQSKGDLRFSISKVTQGSNEPYADFVSRLMEVAGKLFPDVEQAMPLVKQLAYENANKWCREAIRPWTHKDLDTWIKICRDVHDQVTAGVVQAREQAKVLGAMIKGKESGGRTCFRCGKPGHFKRECRQGRDVRSTPKPGLCPNCGKGNHWANECRSRQDITGQPLDYGARPKNGPRGPAPRGPSRAYGVQSNSPTSFGLPQEAQDWTSVPPPTWY